MTKPGLQSQDIKEHKREAYPTEETNCAKDCGPVAFINVEANYTESRGREPIEPVWCGIFGNLINPKLKWSAEVIQGLREQLRNASLHEQQGDEIFHYLQPYHYKESESSHTDLVH